MTKKATINDSRILAEMAIRMWKSHNVVFFIKYLEDIPVGFAQCGLRSYYLL